MRARARDGRVPPCPGGRQARRLRYVADGWRVSLWVFGFFEGRQALLGFVRPFNLKIKNNVILDPIGPKAKT